MSEKLKERVFEVLHLWRIPSTLFHLSTNKHYYTNDVLFFFSEESAILAERARQHREMRLKGNAELKERVEELKLKLQTERERMREDFEGQVRVDMIRCNTQEIEVRRTRTHVLCHHDTTSVCLSVKRAVLATLRHVNMISCCFCS